MKKILSEIQSGEFARQWMAENKSGRHNFLAMRAAASGISPSRMSAASFAR